MAKISNLHGEDGEDYDIISDFPLESDCSVVVGVVVGEC